MGSMWLSGPCSVRCCWSHFWSTWMVSFVMLTAELLESCCCCPPLPHPQKSKHKWLTWLYQVNYNLIKLTEESNLEFDTNGRETSISVKQTTELWLLASAQCFLQCGVRKLHLMVFAYKTYIYVYAYKDSCKTFRVCIILTLDI